MTAAPATQRTSHQTAPSSGAAEYIVHVVDDVDERIAGHGGCAYASPPQPREEALALAGLLLCGPDALAGGAEGCTRTVAVPGGRRAVTVVTTRAGRVTSAGAGPIAECSAKE